MIVGIQKESEVDSTTVFSSLSPYGPIFGKIELDCYRSREFESHFGPKATDFSKFLFNHHSSWVMSQ